LIEAKYAVIRGLTLNGKYDPFCRQISQGWLGHQNLAGRPTFPGEASEQVCQSSPTHLNRCKTNYDHGATVKVNRSGIKLPICSIGPHKRAGEISNYLQT
jgi:hypothetical protein